MNTNILKKFFIPFISILLIFLTGCEVASENDLYKFARNQFGKCDIVSYSASDKSSKLIVTDNKYGFSYTISSSLKDFNVDGSNLFTYSDKYSDFPEKYVTYIIKTDSFAEFETNYKCKAIANVNNPSIYIYTDDTGNASNIAKEAANIFNKYDTRNFLIDNDYMIIVCDMKEEMLGRYLIADNEYQTKQEADIYDLLKQAPRAIANNYEINNPSSEKKPKISMSDIKYQNFEYKKPDEVATDISYDKTKNQILVVYFDYDGNNWLIADCFDYYGNYYVYKVTK